MRFLQLRNEGGGAKFILGSWDNVWHLLACITVRKCRQINRRLGRKIACTDAPNESVLRAAFDREPTPDETACLNDIIEELMRGLQPHERTVLSLRLQGSKPREISEELHVNLRKVQRILKRVRERLERLLRSLPD